MDHAEEQHLSNLQKKVESLEELKRRIQTRLSLLRKSQVAIMIERNLYLSKLREVETYGRSRNWGKGTDDKSVPGQVLLHSIYDVLYDASKSTTTSSER
jgi:hypothetical protein